tara:strand:+ start:1427 stop:2104 length:678 start_codon:yes stop_codon:yes gene_type:complete
MAKTFELSAQKREEAGKGAARAVRREGRVPAVIYGGNEEPVMVSLEEKDVVREYHNGNIFTNICEMDVAGEKFKLLGRDLQMHPVSDRPLHADFLRVTNKTKINVDVPVNFINEEKCPGLEDGGILSVVRRDVEVVCRAIAIPEELVVDLTGYTIGDSIDSTKIDLPDGVEFAISDRDFAIANIAAPKEEEPEEEEGLEEAEGEEGETAEGEAAEGEEEKAEGDE